MTNINLTSIAVYCWSNQGGPKIYAAFAEKLAVEFVCSGVSLVYGGGNVGLMGIIADAMLAQGGKVIGVIPQALVDIEVAHHGLTDLRIVDTMQARKQLIMELSDGCMMLPGGIGSLDEFFEMVTLGQLGFHKKPCGILNVNGYYEHLIKQLDRAVDERFLRREYRDMILIDDTPRGLLTQMRNYMPPEMGKWIIKEEE